MSKLHNLIFFALLVGTLATQGLQSMNPDPAFMQVEQNGRRIVIRPHGFEEVTTMQKSKDTVNLQWALNNLVDGGSIVAQRGNFHISHPLIARGFRGALVGSGIDRTVFTARGPKNEEGHYVFPDHDEEGRRTVWATGRSNIITFVNTPSKFQNVQVRQFTMTVEGSGEELLYFGLPTHNVLGAIMICDSYCGTYNSSLPSRVEHIDFAADSIRIYGQDDLLDADGTNLQQGIIAFGGEEWKRAEPGTSVGGWDEGNHNPVNINFRVTNSFFSNIWIHACIVEGPLSIPSLTSPLRSTTSFTFPDPSSFPPSSIVISNNVFDRVAWGSFYEPTTLFASAVLSPSGTSVTWSGNQFLRMSSYGIVALAGHAMTHTPWPLEPNQLTIEYNYFQSVAPSNPITFNTAAISIIDLELVPPTNTPVLFTVIQYNIFECEVGYSASLVDHVIGIGLAVVANEFKGRCPSAISLGATNVPGAGYLPAMYDQILFNSFESFNSTRDPQANIVLGPMASTATINPPTLSASVTA